MFKKLEETFSLQKKPCYFLNSRKKTNLSLQDDLTFAGEVIVSVTENKPVALGNSEFISNESLLNIIKDLFGTFKVKYAYQSRNYDTYYDLILKEWQGVKVPGGYAKQGIQLVNSPTGRFSPRGYYSIYDPGFDSIIRTSLVVWELRRASFYNDKLIESFFTPVREIPVEQIKISRLRLPEKISSFEREIKQEFLLKERKILNHYDLLLFFSLFFKKWIASNYPQATETQREITKYQEIYVY